MGLIRNVERFEELPPDTWRELIVRSSRRPIADLFADYARWRFRRPIAGPDGLRFEAAELVRDGIRLRIAGTPSDDPGVMIPPDLFERIRRARGTSRQLPLFAHD